MSATSNYLKNKLIDLTRGQAFSWPAITYFGLIVATKGVRANSTAYALNDTLALTANDGKVHLYKCTTAGTSASAQGTLFPGVVGEVITDGTAVLSEQTAAIEANTTFIIAEPSGGAYARVAVAASLANWAGTQGAGTTAASSGTNGTTGNNVALTFPAPTTGWANGFAQAVGWVEYDAAAAGNLLRYSLLSTAKTINANDQAPSFAIGALTFQIDN